MKNCNKNIEKRNPLWYYYFHKSINSEEDEMTQKKGALRLFVYEAEQKGGEFMKRKLSLVLALMMAAGLGLSGCGNQGGGTPATEPRAVLRKMPRAQAQGRAWAIQALTQPDSFTLP